MMQSADRYKRAWEPSESAGARYNSRIIPGTCVLETLPMVNEPDMRYVFVDDFGYAVAYCRQRLREDLTPPNQRGSDESLERWLRMRSAFAPEDLASAWAAADAAFSALLSAFVSVGYSPPLSVHLREIVNSYSLDLELGEIYVLPGDLRALLAQVGYPFTWWDDEEVGRSEQEARTFNFADERHRAALARRLREMNGASGTDEAGATYKPYQSRGLNGKRNDHALN
jgi:hypothetical protein